MHQQAIYDSPCTLGGFSGQALRNGWTLVEEYDPCPESMTPKGEWHYFIVLPSGIQVPITCENFRKLDGGEFYPSCQDLTSQ